LGVKHVGEAITWGILEKKKKLVLLYLPANIRSHFRSAVYW